MSETIPQTHEGTQVPANHGGGFPPFDTTTYPTQMFWLTISFAILFIVMWRVAVPRIGGAIRDRKERIEGDMTKAQAHRRSAEQASADYEAALSQARSRAHALADETHKRVLAEVEDARAKAEAEAQTATADAETRIAALREEARGHVADAARDAASAIVTRLMGETLAADDVAAAVAAAGGR
jgi:F-type H+-transporting ATPase subunit b